MKIYSQGPSLGRYLYEYASNTVVICKNKDSKIAILCAVIQPGMPTPELPVVV